MHPWVRDIAQYFDTIEAIAKLKKGVTPAKAGVQKFFKRLDSRFRGNDSLGVLQLAQFLNLFKTLGK